MLLYFLGPYISFKTKVLEALQTGFDMGTFPTHPLFRAGNPCLSAAVLERLFYNYNCIAKLQAFTDIISTFTDIIN